MRELCIPIPGFNSDQSAEIKLKMQVLFRFYIERK